MDNRHLDNSSAPVDRHLWQITAVRDVILIGLCFSIIWAGYSLRGILTPVLIGLLLAYLFNPFITYAQKHWHLPRPLTITLLLHALIVAGVGLVIWLGPILQDQVATLTEKGPNYLENLAHQYGIDLEYPGEHLQDAASTMKKNVLSIAQAAITGTSQAVGIIGKLVSATTYVLISIVLIPIYFFFFAWHFPAMVGKVGPYLPASKKDQIMKILHRMDCAVGGFFRGRFIVALLMGGMLSIGWLITDVPYWFLLGIGTGLLSIIPYGATLGWPLAVLLKYLDTTTGSTPSDLDWLAIAVWPSVVYGVVQLLEGWLLTPWIQSQSTELSAVSILIVVFIGGAVGGLLGLILAIPLAACVKILLQDVVLVRIRRWADAN